MPEQVETTGATGAASCAVDDGHLKFSSEGSLLRGTLTPFSKLSLLERDRQRHTHGHSPKVDHLRPLVAKFLDSLPAAWSSWSDDLLPLVTKYASADNSVAASTESDRHSCCSHDSSSSTCCLPWSADQDALRRNNSDAGIWAQGTAYTPVGSKPPLAGNQTASRAVNGLRYPESTDSAPTPSSIRPTATPAVATAEQLPADCMASNNGSNQPPTSSRGVFVGNLPDTTTERVLVRLFSRCGRIDRLWIARNASNQASLGYGFVVFEPCSGSQAVLRAQQELDGICLQQQRICVRVSTRSF
eukprot:GHRR01008557.1.p1 GENE.GHRR01008557.1~~GHRR01008557.1.p1  ORF type:complete len:301 (+),score=87.97 GHRR01008557.1:272-1174(+)